MKRRSLPFLTVPSYRCWLWQCHLPADELVWRRTHIRPWSRTEVSITDWSDVLDRVEVSNLVHLLRKPPGWKSKTFDVVGHLALPWVPETFLARFPVSMAPAFGRRRSFPTHARKNLWYPAGAKVLTKDSPFDCNVGLQNILQLFEENNQFVSNWSFPM